MAFPVLSESAGRLWDMLGKLAGTPGADLSRPAQPLPDPPRDLVSAFEDCLAHGCDSGAADAVAGTINAHPPPDLAAKVAPVNEAPAAPQVMPPGAEARVAQVEALPGAMDVFRLQYEVGMLKARETAGQRFSEKVDSSLETLLKQQG